MNSVQSTRLASVGFSFENRMELNPVSGHVTENRVPPGCPSGAEFDGIGWNRKEEGGTTNRGKSKRWWVTTCPS